MTTNDDWQQSWDEIERRERSPLWVKVAREARRRLRWNNVWHDMKRLAWTAQRGRHGIGGGDAADLGYYLCRVGARGLRQMHAWSNSYPRHKDPDVWAEEIIAAAKAMEDWLGVMYEDPPRGSHTAEREAYYRARGVTLVRGQDAWRWVADNLADLWD